MKTKDLIKLLGTKDQQQEVEFLVVDKSTTAIVVMDITNETADLGKLFKAFKTKKKVSPNAEVSRRSHGDSETESPYSAVALTVMLEVGGKGMTLEQFARIAGVELVKCDHVRGGAAPQVDIEHKQGLTPIGGRGIIEIGGRLCQN